jgi:recombinational DNA repair protein RecT
MNYSTIQTNDADTINKFKTCGINLDTIGQLSQEQAELMVANIKNTDVDTYLNYLLRDDVKENLTHMSDELLNFNVESLMCATGSKPTLENCDAFNMPVTVDQLNKLSMVIDKYSDLISRHSNHVFKILIDYQQWCNGNYKTDLDVAKTTKLREILSKLVLAATQNNNALEHFGLVDMNQQYYGYSYWTILFFVLFVIFLVLYLKERRVL